MGESTGTGHEAQRLLDAILDVGRGLELESILRRIVEIAARLVDARYAAMGVLGEDGRIAQFLTVGLTAEEIKRIGPYPQGRGILGELITHPTPLRLHDLGAHPASYGFPPNHPPMRSFLGVPVRVRESVFGNLYLTEKRNDADFDEGDEQLLVTLAAAAGVAIENARLYDEVRRREQWLRASEEIARQLLSGAAPADVLSLFVHEARDVADSDVAAIAVPLVGTGRLVVEAAVGLNADQLSGMTLPADVPATVLDPEGVLGPLLVLPLGEDDRVRGVLIVARRAGAFPFSAAIAETLAAFSSQAAIALELADRRRDAEQLTVLHDRDRIAKDLHDLAIQRLFATGMTLEGIGRMIDNPTVAGRVSRAVDDIDEAIKVIRTTIFALQPREDRAGLHGLRERVLDEVESIPEVSGLAPSLRLEGPVDAMATDEIADAVVAVVREALSNAVRHAKATHVEVSLAAGEELTLRVADDGIGIPPDVPRSGLRNLADRAAALGGELTVEPGDGRGTVLVWRVPLG